MREAVHRTVQLGNIVASAGRPVVVELTRGMGSVVRRAALGTSFLLFPIIPKVAGFLFLFTALAILAQAHLSALSRQNYTP